MWVMHERLFVPTNFTVNRPDADWLDFDVFPLMERYSTPALLMAQQWTKVTYDPITVYDAHKHCAAWLEHLGPKAKMYAKVIERLRTHPLEDDAFIQVGHTRVPAPREAAYVTLNVKADEKIFKPKPRPISAVDPRLSAVLGPTLYELGARQKRMYSISSRCTFPLAGQQTTASYYQASCATDYDIEAWLRLDNPTHGWRAMASGDDLYAIVTLDGRTTIIESDYSNFDHSQVYLIARGSPTAVTYGPSAAVSDPLDTAGTKGRWLSVGHRRYWVPGDGLLATQAVTAQILGLEPSTPAGEDLHSCHSRHNALNLLIVSAFGSTCAAQRNFKSFDHSNSVRVTCPQGERRTGENATSDGNTDVNFNILHWTLCQVFDKPTAAERSAALDLMVKAKFWCGVPVKVKVHDPLAEYRGTFLKGMIYGPPGYPMWAPLLSRLLKLSASIKCENLDDHWKKLYENLGSMVNYRSHAHLVDLFHRLSKMYTPATLADHWVKPGLGRTYMTRYANSDDHTMLPPSARGWWLRAAACHYQYRADLIEDFIRDYIHCVRSQTRTLAASKADFLLVDYL
jgi:hypothetical protein